MPIPDDLDAKRRIQFGQHADVVKRVLVVDDTQVEQKIAAAHLKNENFDLRFATNGRQALEMIKGHLTDLVLTDLVMPEIDGLELVGRIRREHPTIPVVLMTAMGDEETALLALKAGAASYIPKQSLQKHLVQTIRSVLLAARAVVERNTPWSYLKYSESHFVLGYEPRGRITLIEQFEEELEQMDFCDATDRIRVGTALMEALTNAVEHGNLDLDSRLREPSHDEYHELMERRKRMSPYAERRVSITKRVTPPEVVYIVEDEGKGYDRRDLPDPTDPENLSKIGGRGLVLIQTFLDEVSFNDRGNIITMTKRRTTA